MFLSLLLLFLCLFHIRSSPDCVPLGAGREKTKLCTETQNTLKNDYEYYLLPTTPSDE